MLASLPQNAVLVALDERIARDTVLFQLSYLQSVEKFRTDVTVVNDSVARPLRLPDLRAPYGRLETPAQRRQLMELVLNDPAFHDRQLYATFPVEPLNIGWSSYSNGVVYRVVEGGFISDTIEPEPTKLPQLPSAERQAQFALANVVSHALYAQAAFAFDHGGTEAALATLLRAMELDTLPFSQDYQDFILYRAGHTPVP
jgi:hypothetical protein